MNIVGADGTPSCQHGSMHGWCQWNYRGAVLGRAFLLWVLCSPIQITAASRDAHWMERH